MIIATLIAAAIAFGGLTSAAPIDHPGCNPIPITQVGEDQTYACDRYLVDTTMVDGDPVADCLIVEGFHGRPDDGAEQVYATWPEIEACALWATNFRIARATV